MTLDKDLRRRFARTAPMQSSVETDALTPLGMALRIDALEQQVQHLDARIVAEDERVIEIEDLIGLSSP